MVRSLQIVTVPCTWYFLNRTKYFVLVILPPKDTLFYQMQVAAIKNRLAFTQGDFADAEQRKTGKLEQANSGTLFLYEIADLSVSLQHKLLRVLQEKGIQVTLQSG